VAIPSDMDGDPNAARIAWEVVIRVVPDAPLTQAAAPSLSARIKNRTGITPVSVVVDAAGAVTVTMPDTGVDPGFWVGWVASALAGFGRAGVVSATGNQARVTT
jgi:hypothetical protein